MDAPWTKLAAAEESREYVALLSYLPLRSFLRIPQFFRYTMQIQRQMRETPGAIGYALRAKALEKKFWTLSVWASDEALMDFVRAAPHGEVMKSIAPHMGPTKFTRWKVTGGAVPPSWDEAMKRETQGR
jgi:hypothetical protein